MTHQENTGPAVVAGPFGIAIPRLPTAKPDQLQLSRKALRSRIDALANSLPGVDLGAVFAGSPGQSDLVSVVQQLDGFPAQLSQSLFKQYVRRRKDGSARYCHTASRWLRERTQWIRRLIQAIPVDAQQLRDDESRKRVAHQFANQTAAIWSRIQQVERQRALSPGLDLLQTWEAIRQPADQWGFIPAMPKFSSNEQRNEWIFRAVVRLLNAKWWEERVSRSWDRLQEHINILLGKVRKGVSPYISHANMQVVRERKRAMLRWLAESEVVNEQHDLVVSMKDCWEASNANPVNRRNELMVRMRGFEDYSREQGHVGVFFTWTAPSRFHAWKTGRNGKTIENDKYQGATPRDTCAYLAKLWSRARALLKRNQTPVYGFRVCEPHHDGTPHWHMVLFMRPADQWRVIGALQQHALTDDKDELERNSQGGLAFTDFKPRFDWKEIDPSKGDATGYISSYIAKNIDGTHVDGDDEAGTKADVGAQHATAWAAWWRIRQFQQIGGAPVGVWRELRRVSNAKRNGDLVGPPKPVVADPRFEAARYAADNGIFRSYLHAMGGAFATRDQHPIKLAHLIEEQANCYGEDIKRLMGLHSASLGVKTRLQGWEVVPAGTYEAKKAAAGSAWGVAVQTGDSPAPWSSDNNCTQPDPAAFADQVMAEQWGLSPFSIDRLRAGSNVSADGYSLWLENGQVQASRGGRPSTGDSLFELDWLREGTALAPDEGDPYAIPADDEQWPQLIRHCDALYQTQGHAATYQWIAALPDPYRSEMWGRLEWLDQPLWLLDEGGDDGFSDEPWD